LNTASKGRRLEHKVRDLLRERKYFVVRSAGSMGPFDLVAIPMKDCLWFETVLVQVKSRRFSRAEREELKKWREFLPDDRCRIEAWVVENRKQPKLEFAL